MLPPWQPSTTTPATIYNTIMIWLAHIEGALDRSPKEISYLDQWREIEKVLRERFGDPCDVRSVFNSRWTAGLSSFSISGVPRSVYFLHEDDMLAFKLMYPKIEVRNPNKQPIADSQDHSYNTR
jgi:hypothetical protein